MTTAPRPPVGSADVKGCCGRAYSSDLVRLLLGESYHPGGLALTRRLADRLAVGPDRRVLDVASGIGTSALLLADAYGAAVDGVDYSPDNVERARASADRLGLTGRVGFAVGDAEALPFPDDSFDTVICECALCTFPDKPRAAGEFARVLRPGGRLGITDVVAVPENLPEELRGLAGWIACLADARPVEAYQEILRGVGLKPDTSERHDSGLRRMVDQIDARIRLLRMTSPSKLVGTDLDPATVDPATVESVLDATRAAIDRGELGYILLIAERP